MGIMDSIKDAAQRVMPNHDKESGGGRRLGGGGGAVFEDDADVSDTTTEGRPICV